MKKTKQILAIIGIVLLVCLYLTTLLLALLGKDFFQMFMAAMISTIMIPVLIWTYTFVYKLIKKHNGKEEEE
ncbi:MAG: hypothetical protein RSD28_01195 [Lachnospiraceae bacterium]